MQVLAIIVPYTRTQSNISLSCKNIRAWLSNNAFPIRTSKGDLCLENLDFYRFLNYPEINAWLNGRVYRAIGEGRADHLELLLDKRADLEVKDYGGYTHLMRVVGLGKVDCLKLLLKRGANPEVIEDEDGNTALIEAAECGETECLKLLLEHKANIGATDHYGYTALICIASMEDRDDCVRLLLEHGATVTHRLRENYPQYKYLWEEFSL